MWTKCWSNFCVVAWQTTLLCQNKYYFSAKYIPLTKESMPTHIAADALLNYVKTNTDFVNGKQSTFRRSTLNKKTEYHRQIIRIDALFSICSEKDARNG